VANPQTQTVLVVEDESSIASFVSLYLKNAGYGVRAVGTGSGALNAVAAEMPSLIVLDLNLPDMDGIEICRRVRKNSDVPIIMLTARARQQDIEQAYAAGATDYVVKPFSPRGLLEQVEAALQRVTP
jgi:two-component system phosphate regulon response regulator PhoB